MTTATATEQATRTTSAAPHSPPRPRSIRLTLAEIRRLFNRRDQGKRLIHAAMHWCAYRRAHQGEARWYHARRRLKLQVLAL